MRTQLYFNGECLTIYDTKSRLRYCEYAEGFWWTHKYDSNGKVIRGETSTGNVYEDA